MFNNSGVKSGRDGIFYFRRLAIIPIRTKMDIPAKTIVVCSFLFIRITDNESVNNAIP